MSLPMPFAPQRYRSRFLLALAAALFASCSKNSGPPAVTPAFTLHYHRALADYDGWTVAVTGGAVETSATSSTKDGFGAVYPLTVKSGATALTFTIGKGGTSDLAGTLSVDVSGSVREAWVFSGSKQAIAHAMP